MFLVVKPYNDWNKFSFGRPKACPRQPKNAYDLGWPYTNVTQGYVHIQMCPSHHEKCIDVDNPWLKKSSNKIQNPLRYHNSITDLKFQHKPI